MEGTSRTRCSSKWLVYVQTRRSCPQSTKESLDPSCVSRDGPLHRSLNTITHKPVTSKSEGGMSLGAAVVRPHGALDPREKEVAANLSLFPKKKKKGIDFVAESEVFSLAKTGGVWYV